MEEEQTIPRPERANATDAPAENVHIECPSCRRSNMFLSVVVDYAIEGAGFICEHCGVPIEGEVVRIREIRRHAIRTTPPIPAPLTRSFTPTELPNHVRDALELIEQWTGEITTGHWEMAGIQKRNQTTSGPVN